MTDLATQYAPYVDELFTQESEKSMLTNNDFDWSGAYTVKVYKVSTVEMTDYDRNGRNSNGSRFGTVGEIEGTTEEMTLSKDRSFTFVIDKLDKDETGDQLAGVSALARQLREVTVPEVDAYTYNVMVQGAGTTAEAVELTPENIYDEITKATERLDDDLVPESGRILVVTPPVYRTMKKCKDIVLDTEIGADMRIKGVIANLDGMAVAKIAKTRLPENFGFMVAHPCATVAPTKLEDYRIHQDPPGISGELVEGRIVYDAFVLDNKKKAIYYQPVKELVTGAA